MVDEERVVMWTSAGLLMLPPITLTGKQMKNKLDTEIG